MALVLNIKRALLDRLALCTGAQVRSAWPAMSGVPRSRGRANAKLAEETFDAALLDSPIFSPVLLQVAASVEALGPECIGSCEEFEVDASGRCNPIGGATPHEVHAPQDAAPTAPAAAAEARHAS